MAEAEAGAKEKKDDTMFVVGLVVVFLILVYLIFFAT
jgi:hypothetical protein